MSYLPPGYSHAPPGPPSVVHLQAPDIFQDPNSPYPIGSYWELVNDETAVPDPNELARNNHLVRQDFQLRNFRSGTVVQIQGYSSRGYKANSIPPVLAKYALYTVHCVTNVLCSVASGPFYNLKPEQIKRQRSDRMSLKGSLNEGECAYVFANVPHGLSQDTPFIIIEAHRSRIMSSLSTVIYKVRALGPGSYDMRYIIDRDLVHDELRPTDG